MPANLSVEQSLMRAKSHVKKNEMAEAKKIYEAEIDLSLPTNNGMTILGKTTMSLKGNNGDEIFTSIKINMDIISYNAIPFCYLLWLLSRCCFT